MSGGAASGQRGSRYERELVGHFRDAGWGALRLPSSGSATARDLPDVLAGRANPPNALGEQTTWLYAVEAKSGKASTLYVDGDEVAAIRAFADVWGATPLLGARSTRRGTPTAHYLVRPADARQTGGGNYGLPIDGIEERVYAVVGSDGVEVL